jgi:hypothetical protein
MDRHKADAAEQAAWRSSGKRPSCPQWHLLGLAIRSTFRACTHKPGGVMRRCLRPLCPYSDQVRAAAQYVAMGQELSSALLLEHLVSESQQRRWYRNVKGFRRLEVDRQDRLSWELHRQRKGLDSDGKSRHGGEAICPSGRRIIRLSLSNHAHHFTKPRPGLRRPRYCA